MALIEFFALKWAKTISCMSTYTVGSVKFTLTTIPLHRLFMIAKLDAMGQRWVAALMLYIFKIF